MQECEHPHRLSRSPYDREIHISSHPSGAADTKYNQGFSEIFIILYKNIFIIYKLLYINIFINAAVLDTLQPHSATTRPPIAVDWNFRQKNTIKT